jgi:hypothetical protein
MNGVLHGLVERGQSERDIAENGLQILEDGQNRPLDFTVMLAGRCLAEPVCVAVSELDADVIGIVLRTAGDGKWPVELEIERLVTKFHGQPIVAASVRQPSGAEHH